MTISDAWRTGRSERLERRSAPPLILKVVRYVAGRLPTWQGVRTFLYQVAGLGLIDYAVWGAHHLAGYAMMGLSLLWLEYAGKRP